MGNDNLPSNEFLDQNKNRILTGQIPKTTSQK